MIAWARLHPCTIEFAFSDAAEKGQAVHSYSQTLLLGNKQKMVLTCIIVQMLILSSGTELLNLFRSRQVTYIDRFSAMLPNHLSSLPNHYLSFRIIIFPSESLSFLPNHRKFRCAIFPSESCLSSKYFENFQNRSRD